MDREEKRRKERERMLQDTHREIEGGS